MKKSIAVLFLTMILILNSCTCKCIKTYLTKEEKEWFSVYKKGQLIIFKSDLGNLDTIVVNDKYETFGNKDCNCYGIGPIQNNIMGIVLKSKICHNDPYCDGGISISKDQVGEKSFPIFGVFGLICDQTFQKKIPRQESIKLTITDKVYNFVYHIEDNVNANNGGNSYLKSFYWDKKEGLIRYDTSEGEIFELLKK